MEKEMNTLNATLQEAEIQLARHCLVHALEQGAQAVRITLTKSLMNLTGLLNGEVDKVALALDRSMQFQFFADGRFGTFSSNQLEKESLERFIKEAVDTVRMLEPDAFRQLPSADRLVKQAATGKELDLYDPAYESLTDARRREISLSSMAWPRKETLEKGWKLISEEGEYSDSVFDSLTLDSQGLEARHTETSFEIGYECTVEDAEGNHISSYWWDASPTLDALKWQDCAKTACLRAAAQIGPKSIPGGRYNLIVDSECASKLLTPVMNALGGSSLQQKNSFLTDSLGKQVFPGTLTIWDRPLDKGCTGSRLYDSEGVATREMPIIEKGVVKTYFMNTYMAGKMQMDPTVEDCTRIKVTPVGGSKTLDELLEKVQDGLLVTGFNGGNSNPATGNFSYGVEGFLVKGGKRVHPVREILITGDFLSLWNNLLFTADDARPCMSRLIPSLAFKNVVVSA